MLGIGAVWLVVGCTGGTAQLEISTTTVPEVSTSSSSSTSTTAVVDSESILSGFLAAVTDSDASGSMEIELTVDSAGVSVLSTGSSRASGGDSHVVMEAGFTDLRSELLTVDGEVFARDGDGPWIAFGVDSPDGSNAAAGSGSDTLTFLSTLSSVQYVGLEVVDGAEMHRLATPPEFEFDPSFLGLNIPTADISGFKQSFLVDDDGIPARWDLWFEAATYNAMVGRVADTTVVMEVVFDEWGKDQGIEAPYAYSVWHESDRFGYRVAHSSRWDVSQEPAEDDWDAMDVFYAPIGDEIQVRMLTLDEPAVEPLNAWLGSWRDNTIQDSEGVFGDTVHDIEIAGRMSPVQEFQFVGDDGRRYFGFYSVAQLSPDTVHDFTWYSHGRVEDVDLERFTDFLSTVEPAGSTAVLLDLLPVRTCFDDPTEFDTAGYITPIPCEDPHDNELYAVLEMPHDTWPGRSAAVDWAVDACETQLETYTGDISEESSFDWDAWLPHEEGWQAGARSVQCVLWDHELNKLIGSMAQQLDA